MTGDDGQRTEREESTKRIFHVWHAVAAAMCCGLFYVDVILQIKFPWWYWLPVAFIAEPGSFSRLAAAYAAEVVKWLKRA